MKDDLTLAFRSFALLSRDFEEVLEYVHPSHSNLEVHSHRIFALLLRACTDFESLSKAACKKAGIPYNEKSSNIAHYSSLPDRLGISKLEVEVISFQPESLFVSPLNGWIETPHQLKWYRAYNEVKHNRTDSFRLATLGNLTMAISACFLLLVGTNAIPATELFSDDLEDGRKRINFFVGPFAIISPPNWTAPNYWRE